MLTIETRRYSAVVKAFLEQYPRAVAILDNKPASGDIESWCTNENLKKTYFFSIVDNGKEIFGFFDDPRDMWASDETLPFVQTLADQKLLRFSHARFKALPYKRLNNVVLAMIVLGAVALAVLYKTGYFLDIK